MNKTEREKAWDREFNEEWEELWKPLILTNGKLDEHKVKNEMQDLVFIYKQVAEVYCYITGNQLSKAMYYADEVKMAFDDEITRCVNELENRIK
jgi:hypothetical protein